MAATLEVATARLTAWECFDDLREGIGYALSWAELEEWLAQASRAYARGELDASQVEMLTELAIQMSHFLSDR